MPKSNAEGILPGTTKWNGRPVLTTHGCIVLERFTGKSYTYHVINLGTRKSAYLCRRAKPLTAVDFDVIIEKIRMSGMASELDYSVEAKPGERISKERLMEVLDHIFQIILPEYGYSYRTEQASLARHILEALCRRAVSLSEAGVGIGKTHAYLIAAALVKRGRVNDFWIKSKYPGIAYITAMPVVIATSSIALQKAIAKDYIPEISRILMEYGAITKSLSSVIRKGKEHYICEKRLHLFWRQSTRAEIKQLVAPLLEKKGGIDLDEMDFLDPYVKRRINVSGRCGKSCSLYDYCRYAAFLKNAQSDKYDFQVCNHNYLLADTLRRSKGQYPLIPHYQAIVIDEAHKFLQASRQMYGVAISSLTLPRITKTIHSFVFRQGQSTAELWRDADKLRGQATRLFHVLAENVPENCLDDEAERFKTEINGTTTRHLQNISDILSRLETMLKERQVLRKYTGLYAHTLWELANIREHIAAFDSHTDLIYWLEAPEGLLSLNRDGSTEEILLCAVPKGLGRMLRTDLWSKGVPIVLTSGTLSDSGDFSHVKLGMGLDKLLPSVIMETSNPSPFNYRENTFVYISESVPFPDNKDTRYITAVADEMERLIIAAHGHTAALFTSYYVMDRVFDMLKIRGISFPLFKLGRGGMNDFERFRKSGSGVLFAAGSMWEGADLPGNILSLLVIVRLPFAVPDPISEHERTLYESPAKYMSSVIVPEMLIKLKQGFGRLIRSETDTGIVALLDSRVRESGTYRDRVLKALPDCRITSSVVDVRDFMLEKKGPDYFM